jgi:hypothetical protein
MTTWFVLLVLFNNDFNCTDAMKAYGGPRHLLEVSGQLQAPAALPPGKEPPVPIAGRAPEQVWALWSTEKSLAPSGNRTPAIQLVAHRYTANIETVWISEVISDIYWPYDTEWGV